MPDSDLIAVLAGLTTAVILVDGDRRIVFANPAATERFGQDLEGRDLVRAVRHPDCLKAVDDVLNGQAQARATVVVEAPVDTTLQVSVARLSQDKPAGAVAAVCFEDISQVVAVNQMRSDFVANVSHELRSPLTALTGIIETLQDGAKDDAASCERFLELMHHEAARMNRLIGDLLSLSKVEINERVRPTSRADLLAVLERVIATLSIEAESAGKSITLTRPETLEAIPGSEDELIQVFHNLIENALKYGAPRTGITVKVEQLDHAAGISGPAVAIAVQDRGEGIDRHHLPRLTERFYRVDAGRSRNQGGTGLGLAIVKHIVKRHRGRLQVDSTKGAGSTFTVFLPATGIAPGG